MLPRARYLRILAATALISVGAAAVTNLIVDPYSYFRLISVRGFNLVKPRPDHDLVEIKRAAVNVVRPDALILGNSRAEVGFDPEHASWSARTLSAYNYALPGSTIRTAWEVLDEQADALHPRLIVVGVEFLDFLADPAAPHFAAPARRPRSAWSLAATLARALFTWNALTDSAQTIAIQHATNVATITSRGFNPLQEYVETARIDGYHALFRQRAMENAAQYVRKARSVRQHDGRPAAAFDYLRALLRAAAAQGTDVNLVIYPYHAQLMLMFEDAGLWPAFEEWKRQLVALAAQEQSLVNVPTIIWDFSGFTPFTTETIPQPGDLVTTTHWYWEGGHFKCALGDIILGQVLGTQRGGFGVRLDDATIDEHIARIRAQRDAFREQHPAVAKEVRDLVDVARKLRPH
jgi:hypothetical protein